MEETPGIVRELVRQHIASMDHLEVLMRLYEHPENALSLEELQRLTHVDAEGVKRCAADLVTAGLIRQTPQGHRYGPHRLEDREAVAALATMYNQRPVTLVKLVYDRPSRTLRSFSDAFRLRDPEDR